jgi:hypothetical protein
MTVRTDAKGATVTMPTSVQDKEMDRVANFHEDIEASPFAQDLAFKSEPMCKLEESKTHTPPWSLTFPLTMQFKPTVVEAKPGPKPAVKPAAPAQK